MTNLNLLDPLLLAVLMYIHRGYFAKALLENPDNPLMHEFSHSYLSAYRAAISMLKVIRSHYESFPNLVSRFWSLWSHAFSATVSLWTPVLNRDMILTF